MPARGERIYLCPGEGGRPAWVMDFPAWWDRSAFFKAYGQRAIDTGNPFFADTALLLTAGEAAAWDRRCREALAQDPSGRLEAVSELMRLWDERLEAARWVIVESYEWESGLD